MARPSDEYIKKGRDIIQRHGWVVQAILPDKKQPSYSYTVGLSQSPTWHPEIFMVGFHPDLSRQLLNGTGEQVRNGRRYDRATLADEIIESYPVAFMPIQSRCAVRHSSAGRAILGKPFDGVQLILPDAQGLFPWESGCDVQYAAVQMSLLDLYGNPPTRQ
jgi:hypothetical protein